MFGGKRTVDLFLSETSLLFVGTGQVKDRGRDYQVVRSTLMGPQYEGDGTGLTACRDWPCTLQKLGLHFKDTGPALGRY